MSDIHTQTEKLLAQLQSLTTNANTFMRPKPTYYDVAQELAREAEPITQEIDELQNNLPPLTNTIDGTVREQPTNLPADNAYTPIGFELWEALAYDLALDHADRNTILEAYGLTENQLNHLMGNAYFEKMLQAKRDEIKQIGSDAAFVVKMRMVANRATPQFLKRLTDNSTSNKDFVALFKMATEFAQLTPQADDESNVPQAVIGASITFNIQGVPGLEHLANASIPPPPDDITDAEWTEVDGYKQNELVEL